jgi:hypothetical protein
VDSILRVVVVRVEQAKQWTAKGNTVRLKTQWSRKTKGKATLTKKERKQRSGIGPVGSKYLVKAPCGLRIDILSEGSLVVSTMLG